MALRVLKPFKTLNRKFAAGDAVSEDDIDPGSFCSLADWIAAGFVADDTPPAASKPTFLKSPTPSASEQTQTA